MSIELVMPSKHLILCCPLLLPPSIFPSISVFSNESVLRIRWPKHWSFSFSIHCLTLWDPVACRTLGFRVHHQLQGLAQTHVHRISDAIQPSNPLSTPSPLPSI